MVKMKSIKAIFRRAGHNSNQTATTVQNENLSRTSSTTNLASGTSGGAKPKKSRADDLSTLERLKSKKSSEKRSNNNLLLENNDFDSIESTTANDEDDVDKLRRKLVEMDGEKKMLSLQLNETTLQKQQLYKEVSKLKLFKEESCEKLEQLVEENASLRNRLRDVAHSPLSDTEKQQLLFNSQQHHRHHSSAPASIATNLAEDGVNDGNVSSTCPPTPNEWPSSGNVSVACLQDKINQMQETHYSTNEELQATLQELTDLQRQLSELQAENQRLNEEKTLMFESLCRQTERLNDSRQECEQLKHVLYKNDDTFEMQAESAAEREAKLVGMLKQLETERDQALLKENQQSFDLNDLNAKLMGQTAELLKHAERIKQLESILDGKVAENKQIDMELQMCKDQSNARQIEINRLKELLENAKCKIFEMEQDRQFEDKSDMDELVDNMRKEKDLLESEIANYKEQLALSTNTVAKLNEKVSILHEEAKVQRNNAKTIKSDLEYQLEKCVEEKTHVAEQLQHMQQHLGDLQLKITAQNDEKRQLSTVLAETQRNLAESESKIEMLSTELIELKKHQQEQEEEWEKFQNDLLTSVRVANDFKTEAQQDLQKLIMENKSGRERIKQLEMQIEKMKAAAMETTPSPTQSPSICPPTFQLDEITTARRQKCSLSRQNSRQSVKSLIESIENAAKPVATKPQNDAALESRSSSSLSLNSLQLNEVKTPSTPPTSPLKLDPWASSEKTPLKEQQGNVDWMIIGSGMKKEKQTEVEKSARRRTSSNYDLLHTNNSSGKDPLNGLVKNGGSKRNALLKWCQNKTVGYRNIDITNFSSSWNDGLALCALMHTYLPELIPYDNLQACEKRRNFSLAFNAAESVGIPTTLNINDMILLERPDWQQVMSYVTAIYKHFET